VMDDILAPIPIDLNSLKPKRLWILPIPCQTGHHVSWKPVYY
jgi:hypothetical protein